MNLAWLPNALTLSNLLCGSLACYFAAKGSFPLAAGLVAAGAVFDVLDGAAARGLRVQSPLGVQLDSLADLVTFGLAPALALVEVFLQLPVNSPWQGLLYLVLPFVLPLAAAYRLARFNVASTSFSKDDAGWFKGLPTPAVGLALIGVPLATTVALLLALPWIVVGVSALMVSRLPMLSNKVGAYSGRERLWLVAVLVGIGLSVVWLGYAAGPFALGVYVLGSVGARFMAPRNKEEAPR
jgi:CDP-diacylglycerol---serine O-phosphatidyltransferase